MYLNILNYWMPPHYVFGSHYFPSPQHVGPNNIPEFIILNSSHKPQMFIQHFSSTSLAPAQLDILIHIFTLQHTISSIYQINQPKGPFGKGISNYGII